MAFNIDMVHLLVGDLAPVGYFLRSNRQVTLRPFAVVVLAMSLTVVS